MSKEDFVRKCAETLDWKLHKDMLHTYARTDTDEIVHENDMDFDSSYDWSMLLVKRVKDTGFKVILETYNTLDAFDEKLPVIRVRIWDEIEHEEFFSNDSEDFDDFPRLISSTCLEFFEMLKSR